MLISRWMVVPVVVAGTVWAASAQAESPQGKGEVSRMSFTTGIEEREPIDHVVSLDTSHNELYFFSELKFLEGHTIIHRWEHEGHVIAEVPFEVGGPRWRVYSKVGLDPSQTGEWTVVVYDQSTDWPLAAEMFLFKAAATETPAAPPGDGAPQP